MFLDDLVEISTLNVLKFTPVLTTIISILVLSQMI